jgi:hypothetical protein
VANGSIEELSEVSNGVGGGMVEPVCSKFEVAWGKCNERLSRRYVIESYQGARYSNGLRGADGKGRGRRKRMWGS